MPIRIQSDLPAKAELDEENIFVMDEKRALSQDFRELRIVILNLMPIKQDTELQLLRALILLYRLMLHLCSWKAMLQKIHQVPILRSFTRHFQN